LRSERGELGGRDGSVDRGRPRWGRAAEAETALGDFRRHDAACPRRSGARARQRTRVPRLRRGRARRARPHPRAPPRMTVLAIFGPTASGKTAVAEAVAERIPAEIVSADSMQ